MKERRICITGAAGYLGQNLIEYLLKKHPNFFLLASDISLQPVFFDSIHPGAGFEYLQSDIRKADWNRIFTNYRIDCVIHLASIVNPGKKHNRDFAYSVDVEGTRRVLAACIKSGVKQIIITSSGAAYGYHADNPVPLTEEHPVRGNYEFAYAYHKRLVEEMLFEYRSKHPELKQLIFRPGTILGKRVSNQITALFEKNPIPALKNSESPFVFIWDQDVIAAIVQGVLQQSEGIYNLAGDGILSLAQIAQKMGHRIRRYPEWLLKVALFFLRLIGKTPYGPEQIRFLAYRPVLSNTRLKQEFGYKPKKTSAEVFEFYLQNR